MASNDSSRSSRDWPSAREIERLRKRFNELDRTQRSLARLDVDRTYRELVACFDVTRQMRETLAGLDVDRTFRDLTAPLAGMSDSDLLASVSAAKPLVEALIDLDEAIGSDTGLEAVSAAIDDVELPPIHLSDGARYAIAVYVALLVFSLCAGFYFWHPDLAQLALDASTPTSWSLIVGQLVLRKLGGDDDGGEQQEDGS